jgi:hypothetical protein
MASPIYDLLGAALFMLGADVRARAKEYCFYSLEWVPMTAAASNQKATFTVDSNNDFVGLLATWYATDTAAPPVEIAAPQVMINLAVSGGRNWGDKPVHLKNFCGQQTTAGFPTVFPIWLARSTTLNAFITDLANTARNIRITIHGFALYDRLAATSKSGGF